MQAGMQACMSACTAEYCKLLTALCLPTRTDPPIVSPCCSLCPGGVQECLHMQHDGSETAYLKRRHGFVKLAMAAGVPLVGV